MRSDRVEMAGTCSTTGPVVSPGSCLPQNSRGGRGQGGLHPLGRLRASRGNSALASCPSPGRQDLHHAEQCCAPAGRRWRARKTWLARLKKRDSGVWRGPVIPGDSGAGHPCRCLPGNGSWRSVLCCVQTSWPLGAGQCSVPHSGAHAATGPSPLALSSPGPGGSNLPASEELSGGVPRGSAACWSRMQTLPGWSRGPEPHF